jgi:mannose-6-phosphate isomerase-like protein (cupin superfamily)
MSPSADQQTDSKANQPAAAHSDEKRWSFASLADMPTTACSCGQTRRAFTDDPDQTASIHMVDITTDAQTHYHKKLTEIYLILEGEGHMELDGERVPVKPLDTILIKPGCRHRAVGQMRIVNIPVPAFDPNDEWFD